MKDFFKRTKQKLDTHKEKLSSDLVKLPLAYKTSDGGIFENETDAIRRQDTLNNRKLYGEFYDSVYMNPLANNAILPSDKPSRDIIYGLLEQWHQYIEFRLEVMK